MMALKTLIGCLVLATALLGCSGSGSVEPDSQVAAPNASTATTPSDPVAKAVAVAREIEADADDVDAILERHGLTVETFEELLYDISSDPELSKRYNAALGL